MSALAPTVGIDPFAPAELGLGVGRDAQHVLAVAVARGGGADDGEGADEEADALGVGGAERGAGIGALPGEAGDAGDGGGGAGGR